MERQRKIKEIEEMRVKTGKEMHRKKDPRTF